MSLSDQIIEPSRRGNQNIHTCPQLLNLRILIHAAEDHGASQRKIFAVLHEILMNLESQLTGRCKNQCANGAVTLLVKILRTSNTLQNGECKSRCFARTCLGAPQHILAKQDGGNGLLLYGGRLGIAHLADRPQNGADQIHLFKLHMGSYLFIYFLSSVLLYPILPDLSIPRRKNVVSKRKRNPPEPLHRSLLYVIMMDKMKHCQGGSHGKATT